MKINVRKAKDELSWDRLIKKLIIYYKEILNENILHA